MKLFILALVLVASSTAIEAFPIHNQPESYLPYAFGFSTADGITRQEQQGHNGVVSGSFSYTDPNGDLRQVKYTADQHGYRAEGDIGVDRKTAELAAQMAALAPKGPQASHNQQHWAPAVAAHHFGAGHYDASHQSYGVVPFQSYNSFEKMVASLPAPPAPAHWAPAPAPSHWNNNQQKHYHQQAHYNPVASASSHHHTQYVGQIGSYQVDTPTHKIWVKY